MSRGTWSSGFCCTCMTRSVLPLLSPSTLLVGSLWVYESQEAYACGHMFVQTLSPSACSTPQTVPGFTSSLGHCSCCFAFAVFHGVKAAQGAHWGRFPSLMGE